MDNSVLKLNESFDGIPVLTLEPSANLAWHGGYRFQVSTTMDGLSSVGSSTTSMDSDLRLYQKYDISLEERNVFNQLMVLSHVYQASIQYPKFWKEMFKDATLLNSLLKETTKSCDFMLMSKEFDLHKLLDLIEESDEVKSSPKAVVFTVINDQDEKSVGAKVIADENSLSLYNLETNKWYTLDLTNVLSVKLSEEDYQETLSRFIYVLGCKAKLGWHFEVTNFDEEVVAASVPTEGKVVNAHRLSFELGRLKLSSDIKRSSIFGN